MYTIFNSCENKAQNNLDWSGFTILVIDDEQSNVEVLESILELKNTKVLVAKCGSDGLDFLRKNQVDIVLLDIRMPEMDGYEVLSQIRNQSGTTLVIAQTACASGTDRKKMIKSGFDDIIIKPFRIQELFNKIENLLK